MSKLLESLFPTLADLQEAAPGISSDIRMSELNSSSISARKQIENTITKTLWEMIIDAENEDPAKTFLRVAFANITMFKYQIFDLMAKRVSGNGEVYKHELEAMRRHYIDNYYNAMDSLVQELDTSDTYKDAWHETPAYNDATALQVKTTAEFNSFYGIDMSYLFFFRTISIQHEVLDDVIGSYFDRVLELENRTDLERKLKRALVHLVISLAIMRFDIIELPPTIRSLFDEQKSTRSGADESAKLKELSASLHKSALDILQIVDLALQEPDSNNIETETSFNRPEDKIFLMS